MDLATQAFKYVSEGQVLGLGTGRAASAFVRALAVPGLALQKLTTRPPDDEQIEVAISAMTTALAADKGVALDPLASAARG